MTTGTLTRTPPTGTGTHLLPPDRPVPTGPVWLTAIPAAHLGLTARVRDWTDHDQAHKAVMSLFPDNLDGPRTARRATGTILWRLDQDPNRPPRLLVQHTTGLRPDVTADPTVQTTRLDQVIATLTPGQTVRYRLVANPVRAVTGRRGHRAAVKDPDELLDWAATRLAQAGLAEIIPTDLPETKLLRHGNTPLWTARFQGHAAVSDSTLLQGAVAHGIGRARAYGCGLLSVLPA